MALAIRSRRIWEGLAVIVVLMLVYAWFDGGEEPLREVVQPVAMPAAVPGAAQ